MLKQEYNEVFSMEFIFCFVETSKFFILCYVQKYNKINNFQITKHFMLEYMFLILKICN